MPICHRHDHENIFEGSYFIFLTAGSSFVFILRCFWFDLMASGLLKGSYVRANSPAVEQLAATTGPRASSR